MLLQEQHIIIIIIAGSPEGGLSVVDFLKKPTLIPIGHNKIPVIDPPITPTALPLLLSSHLIFKKPPLNLSNVLTNTHFYLN